MKHGIAATRNKGSVAVTVAHVPSGLSISVRDTGPGFDAKARGFAGGAGIGLANVRQRLRLCYGERAEFTIRSDENGTIVSFLIPASNSASEIHSTLNTVHSSPSDIRLL